MPRQIREREMLAAAARTFGRTGYAAASMDEIAAEAGIAKPMLYSYFGSKAELFEACGRAAAEHLRDAVNSAAARHDESPDQRLWRGLVEIFTFIDAHRNLWSIFNASAADPPAQASDIARSGRTAMAKLMEELLQATAIGEGIDEEAARQAAPLAHALTAAVLGMAEWWVEHPDEPAELQALRIMNLVWTGFGGLLDGEMWLPQATEST